METDNNMRVNSFYDPATGTFSYLVVDEASRHCAIIDPVLDYKLNSGRTSTVSADRIVGQIESEGLSLQWILETHAHADHLSAARHLQQRLGGQIAIGGQIGDVQQIFKGVYHLEPSFAVDGSQFDQLFFDEDSFSIGTISCRVLATPGHTPACITYEIGGALFVGDTLFMPDLGSARCDFPGGDAAVLYGSVRKLLDYPPDTLIYLCHDYPVDRAPCGKTTVRQQRHENIHVHDGVTEQEFVAMRQARDATLDLPLLIIPSVQVNIRAGEQPPAEADGYSYLKVPLNKF